MKTNLRSPLLSFWLGLLLLCGSANPLRAQVIGAFFYEIVGGTQVTITSYDDHEAGAVTVPAQIGGLPVTAIGDYAFYGCTGLASITMPASVTSIGYYAFTGCTGLTSMTIPAGVTSIGNQSFNRCTGLTAFSVTPGNTHFSSVDGLLYNASGTSLRACPGGRTGDCSIPAGVTSIGDHAFSSCTGLTSVTMPAGVTSVGDFAFSYCTGLTSVTIPAGVTSIGEFAFSDCIGLTSVSVPASVTSIGSRAFGYCTGLTSVTIPAGVTSIGQGAFVFCRGLITVNIPASVTSIGQGAFSGCTGLAAFLVTPGNAHFSSVDGLLYNASGTSLLACPGGRTGGYSIPAGVTSIDSSAFYYCRGLTSVTIPASITSIGDYVLSNCTGLTSVTIPASITSIGVGAFSGCYGLTSVTLQLGLETLGHSMFGGCTGLTSVTIPASVISIGTGAFYGCYGLQSAAFQGNAPATTWGDSVFITPAPGFTVYYFTNSAGFTSPTWKGNPSIGLAAPASPAATWLLAHGLPYNTNLQLDPDGDGVSLLMAYALNLDPRQNLRSRLPAPVLGEGSLSISFYAGTPGMTYQVETSRDLTQWTTADVTLSALDAENKRTASVPRDAAGRFMRLVVQ